MLATRTKAGRKGEFLRPAARSDEELVRACLNGNQEAWSDLVDKYKNLVFSIPIKYGFSRDDSSDVFQEVCLELLSGLEKVRDPRALPKWLMMVTAHKCFQRTRQGQRLVGMDPEVLESAGGEIPAEAVQIIAEAEQDLALREAIDTLPSRCRELIAMLFFEDPPRPYQRVAEGLGIAVGSIGFIRQRCLERLRKKIESLDLPNAISASQTDG